MNHNVKIKDKVQFSEQTSTYRVSMESEYIKSGNPWQKYIVNYMTFLY